MGTINGCCQCGIKITDRRQKEVTWAAELKQNIQSLCSVLLESLAETYDQDASATPAKMNLYRLEI